MVREQRRTVRRAEARRLCHVLDADDESGEGSRIRAVREGGVNRGRFRLGRGIHGHDRVQRLVVALDAGQAGPEQVGCAQLTRADAAGLLAGREQRRIAAFRHGRRISPAPAAGGMGCYGRNIWAIASPYLAESKGSAFVWSATTTP